MTINAKVRSWVRILGEITEISTDAPQITVETKALDADGNVRKDKMGELCIDKHPVLVQDPELFKKLVVGKRIGFHGWIRRIGQRTKLIMDPAKCVITQKSLKNAGYVNKAGLAGLVVYSRPATSDPSKQAQLTLGVGLADTVGTAIWASVWGNMAKVWDQLLFGNRAEAQIIGRMRSRVNPNNGQTMYEVVGLAGSKLITEPITTGFDENFDEGAMDAAMAFEFSLPDDMTGAAAVPDPSAEDSPLPVDDDIPF
jgi:hypothetical protein